MSFRSARGRAFQFPLLALALAVGCQQGPGEPADHAPGSDAPDAVAERLRASMSPEAQEQSVPVWASSHSGDVGVDPASAPGATPGEPTVAGAKASADTTPDKAPADPSESRSTAIVQAAERISPAVVAINVVRTQRVRPRTFWEELFLPPGAARRVPGLGSGFVLDGEQGIIATNEHVVRDAEEVLVTLPDGQDLEAWVVGVDSRTDVAVLQAEAGELPEAVLGSSEDLLIGEWAVAVGNPFGSLISNPEPSVSTGVVSAVGRHIGSDRDGHGFYLGMIQTDAPINPGNSGGPLVNAEGEVVGMNASIFTRGGGSEGLGFAIPIERVVRVSADLIEHGSVRRPWVGLDVEPVEADAFGRSRGVRVARVASESPAEAAGLEPGDRLLHSNEVRLVTPLDFEAILLDLEVGDEMVLEVADQEDDVRMVTQTLPSMEAERVRVMEDLELATLTPGIRSEREIASEHGALVTGISSSLENQIGLRSGDVILQVNNVLIQEAAEAADVLELLPDGAWVRVYFERNRGVSVREFRVRR